MLACALAVLLNPAAVAATEINTAVSVRTAATSQRLQFWLFVVTERHNFGQLLPVYRYHTQHERVVGIP